MFVLLQTCFTTCIVGNIFKWLIASGTTTNQIKLCYLCFSQIYFMTDCIVHSLFAVRYWALSRKIKAVLKDRSVKYLRI